MVVVVIIIIIDYIAVRDHAVRTAFLYNLWRVSARRFPHQAARRLKTGLRGWALLGTQPRRPVLGRRAAWGGKRRADMLTAFKQRKAEQAC